MSMKRSLAQGYAAMRAAYTRMFQRMGLNFRTVQADTGAIGGSASEEFQVLADSGEDAIAISDADEFAANVELAAGAAAERAARAAQRSRWSAFATPGAHTIEQLERPARRSRPSRCLKTLIVDRRARARR